MHLDFTTVCAGGVMMLPESNVATRYTMSALKAPVVSGLALRVFSYIATQTPFGGAIRRLLLNDNGILQIRELAAQLPAGFVPLSFPMRRLNRTERGAYDAAIAAARAAGAPDVDSVIVPLGAAELQSQPPAALRNSEVLKLHRRLLAGETTSVAITKKASHRRGQQRALQTDGTLTID
jgi:hypothetical protein